MSRSTLHKTWYNSDDIDLALKGGIALTVFEYAVWQYRTQRSYGDDGFFFNSTIRPSIKDIGNPIVKLDNSIYAVNTTFFLIRGPEEGRPIDVSQFMELTKITNAPTKGLEAAAPIGVRCVSTSTTGTAKIDSVTSTFRDFQRLDPIFDVAHNFGLSRFRTTTI